ncbi:MAG: EF-hand domain-containing protein [Pirellulaceae bacterium]
MKHHTTIFLAIWCCVTVSVGFAQQPDAQPRDPNRQQAERFRGQMDPSFIVNRFIREFDKDGDEKLDATELTALFSMLRDQRGRFGQGRGTQRPEGNDEGRRPEADQRAEAGRSEQVRRMQQLRRQQSEQAAKPGGDLPRRPPAK